jgi:hypothetical protein
VADRRSVVRPGRSVAYLRSASQGKATDARTHEGRRRPVRGRGAATHPPHAPPARRPRPRGHPHRLRHLELRCVHRRHRRRERQVVRGARGPGGRRHHHHDPGARRVRERQQRGLAPGAARLPAAPRPAVRLLHSGHDHGHRRPAQAQPEPDRGRGPARARGQPLSLHRLPEHRQGGAVGGLGAARRRDRSRARSRTRPRARARRPPRPSERRHDRAAGRGPGGAADRRAPGVDVGAVRRRRARPRAAPQGGREARHRPDHLDRQHRPARAAAHDRAAQPHGPRADPVGRRVGRARDAGRHRRLQRGRPRRRHGRDDALRLAGHPGHGLAGPHAARHRRGALRR